MRDLLSVISGESHAPSEVESDVESLPALNLDNTDNEPSLVEEDMPIVDLSFGAAARAALQGLDDVDLEAEFCTRACVMKSPPTFLRGHYRSAMRFALSESDRARDRNDPAEATNQSLEVILVAPSFVAPPPCTWRQNSEVSLEGSLLCFCSWPVGRFTPPESAVFRTVCSFDSQTTQKGWRR